MVADALPAIKAELVSIDCTVIAKSLALVELIPLFLGRTSRLGEADPAVVRERELMANRDLASARIAELIAVGGAVVAKGAAPVDPVALEHGLGGALVGALSAAAILCESDPAVRAKLVAYGDLAGIGVTELLVLGLAVCAGCRAGNELITLCEWGTVRDGSC
jgi:hypothetical protein